MTPQRSETFSFPIKVYEYLACGRPVVIGNLKNKSKLFNTKDGEIQRAYQAYDRASDILTARDKNSDQFDRTQELEESVKEAEKLALELLKYKDILSFEEIVEVIKTAVAMGITKVRLTGGEPLVRRGILNLVQSVDTIKDIEDFAMTTNGILLAQYAQALVDAGLKRINISLDTIEF